MKKIFLLAWLLIFIPAVNAQQAQYHFDHLSLEEGITHNLTYSILQDSKGFMWFGTFYGLIRHDGREYKNFKHIPFDTTSVSSDDIISLYEDRHGYIWVGTWSGGLNRFDPDTEEFHQFKHDSGDSLSISNDVVYAMCEDKSGRLWIGTENGLNRFVPENDPGNTSGRSYFVKYFKQEGNKFSINNNNIRSLYQDSRGRLWIGANEGGLHYYQQEKDRFIRLEEVTRDGSTSIINILEDEKNNLWVATWGGGLKKVQVIESDKNEVIGLRINVFRYDANNKNSISSNSIWSLEKDKTGNLWIGTYDGLNMFDPVGKKFYRYYHDPRNTNTISSDKISAIKLDRSGVLWIGTFRGGIDRIVPGLAQFEHFLYNPFDPRSLIDKEVTALLQDKQDNIWVGTISGITRIDKKNDQYRYHRFQFKKVNPKNKMDNYITTMVEDEKGNIWVGTHNGLNCIRTDGSVSHYDLPILPDENEQGNIITSLLVDKNGWLWVGTITHGLNLFDTKTGIFTSFTHDQNDSASLSTNYVVSLYEDRQGTIWVGTYSGLDKLMLMSPSSGQPQVSFHRFLATVNGGQITDNIFSLYEDSRNNMWIGTNAGLIFYNRKDKTTRKFDETTGLPNNVICGILEDNDKNLWVSTFKGIFKLNTIDYSVNNYYTLHGLQGNIFSPGAFFKNSDGKMMFGGLNGFNAFYPENVTRYDQPPPVVITSFKVFDEELELGKRISDVQEIVLTYDQNFFTITFAALDYRLPERNQFYYYLEGFDRDWVYNETKNYASYTNLDPDEYVFHVRGSNSNGIWNNTGATLRLVITPPWWQTWWMKSISGVSILTILLFIIFLIQKNEKGKTEINKKISELKLQALRAQMNPHFIFNTINSIQYFISCNDRESAFMYLSKFSKLMRQTLDNSAKSRISVKRELEALSLYMDLQKLRFENKFEYQIDVDPQIDVHNFEIPTMLIQPYIENAINHGISKKKNQGHIHVFLNRENNNLHCIVEDDGIGINKSLEQKNKNENSDHTSSGMRLTRERLNIINAGKTDNIYISVVDRSEEDKKLTGTKVTISIPLFTNHN
ncbi:MAG: histidine kinase [Calditrichaeota bacterium]|nr:histidine kinase [Calditrichota bacterium]